MKRQCIESVDGGSEEETDTEVTREPAAEDQQAAKDQ